MAVLLALVVAAFAALTTADSSAGRRIDGIQLRVGTRAAPRSLAHPEMSGDRLLVRFRAGATATQERRARRSLNATVLERFHLVPGLELLRVTHAARSAASLKADASVRYAVADVGMPVQATPNDPLYPQQWAPPTFGVPAAWNRTTGSASVTVAILDTGITLNHPDLAANIWTNPGEIPGNGIDDDGDGYVDDVHGWNFTNGTNDPTDTIGHGTHVAGIIGAVGNNNVGVAGVNWRVRLMSLKVCNDYCYQSDEIAALQYAVDHGVRIANSSFGAQSSGYQPEEDAIAAAGAAGLLDVIAAGNDINDNDVSPFYPASYPLDNILSVAAAQDETGALAAYSDYGATSVDLNAPGTGILSTLPEGAYGTTGGYGTLSGTSMAAPQVAGAAALLLAQHPSWKAPGLKNRLLTTTETRSALAGKVLTCGELDLDAATDPAVPARARICVHTTGTGGGSVASSPSGLACGSACGTVFTPGARVTLTATPSAGSTFAGWSGPCSGTGTCVVTAQGAQMVTARFRAPLPAGWSETLLRAPDGRDVVPPGLDVFGSFFNASESAAGTERALTVYDNLANCGTTDTGGIYMQRKAGGTWTADGTITAPTLGSGDLADWPNCGGFGTVTRLSRDGSWALASTEPRDTLTPDGWRNLCAAWIYHRGTTGWTSTPPALLVPPNVDPATGMADAAGCPGWGYEGGISDTGDRVAMWDDRRVDVYHRSSTGWSLEQELMLPTGAGCVATGAPRRLALSGDGAVIVVSDPDCSAGRRAYIYTRSGTSWTLVQTLTGTHVAAEDVSISADGNLITVNAAVFERTPTGWQFRTGLSTPGSVHVGCPAIVLKDTRIICGSFEAVGFNASQGAVYVFGPASGGWANGAVTIARLFSPDGFASDNLTASGKLRWSMVAASADASSILAPMPPDNVAAGLYPSDVMGYEFTQEPTHPPVAVSITDSGFSPASLNVKQGQTVNWTNNGTRSHTATDSSGMRLFFSGTLAPHASYSFTFTAAGVYPYKSAATEPAPLNGTVKVPLTVSPLTGTTATSFTITWSSAAPPAGYVVDIQKRHRSCATCTWSAWASWKSGQTARTAAFMPNQGKGMYGFRARLRKTANGTSSGWSAATAITVS